MIRRGDARQHEPELGAEQTRERTVGRRSVTDDEVDTAEPRPDELGGGLVRLAGDYSSDPASGRDGSEDRTAARQLAVWNRERGVRVRPDQSRPGVDRLHRLGESVIVEARIEADDYCVVAVCSSLAVAVARRHPSVRQRLEASRTTDDEGALTGAKERGRRGSRREHVLLVDPDALAFELAEQLGRGDERVVGEEGHPTASFGEAVNCLVGAWDGRVAAPDDAVQIDEDDIRIRHRAILAFTLPARRAARSGCHTAPMPRFEPFRGLRYDPSRVLLDDVIAPPYDVVDSDERARLAERSPYNSILIELPIGEDPYQHAAALLDAWEREGVLVRDEDPALYVYRMSFERQGVKRTTTGVIGAVGLDGAGGAVLPHERTMSRPAQDRLELLRACQVNLSPIWGLSLAEGLSEACAAAIASADDHRIATDDEGTTHEIWAARDRDVIERISALVAPERIVIADGHHRFETATRYRQERRSQNGDQPGDFDLIMMLVVQLSPEELAVEPTHRLLSGLPERVDLAAELGSEFRLEPAPDDPEAIVAAMASRGALGLVTPEGSYLLDAGSASTSDLDTERVEALLEKLPSHELSYQRGAAEAIDAVRSKGMQAAVLVNPPSVEQIADTARRGVMMPPKTTYFAPKPRTGMVFREVRS